MIDRQRDALAGAATLVCKSCDGMPAAEATFRGHVTVLFKPVRSYVRGPLCRDCGIASFRRMTARTLAGGWYGPLAVVLIPYVIVANLINRRKVVALASPQFDAPGRWPQPIGRPLFLRWQIAGFVIPLACVAGVVWVGHLPTSSASRRDTTIGKCVQMREDPQEFDEVEVVDCFVPHRGRVVSSSTRDVGCPPGDLAMTNSYDLNDSKIYCVKPDNK